MNGANMVDDGVAMRLLDDGSAMAEMGAFSTAESEFRRALQLLHEPGTRRSGNLDLALAGYRNLGHVLLELRRPNEAAGAYRNAIQTASELGDTHEELRSELRTECAAAFVESSRTGQGDALVLLQAASELLPSNGDVRQALANEWLNTGVALHDGEGHLPRAIEATNRAISLSIRPAFLASSYVNLGLLHVRLARQHHHNHPPSQQWRISKGASDTSEDDNRATALSAFAAAAALAPGAGDAYYHAANELRVARREDEAVATLRRGLARSPMHAGLRSHLGYALLATGRDDDAREGMRVLREPHQLPSLAEHPWRNAPAWQHPAELLPGVPSVGVHAMGGESPRWDCILARMEATSDAVASEALALLAADEFKVQHEAIARPQWGWREYDVLTRCRSSGEAPPSHLLHTCRLLSELNSTDASNGGGRVELRGAAFSALLPHTRLLAHCGPSNRRLTLHMGLSVPMPGAAVLRVGAPTASDEAQQSTAFQEIAWAEGKAFVWDDSFTHEVLWRQTNEPSRDSPDQKAGLEGSDDPGGFAAEQPRVILLLTIQHPALIGQGGPPCALA